MKKVLEVKNVTKSFYVYKNNIDRLKDIFFKKNYAKKHVANKNITFDLYEGETLGIIGLNGAGKSTILKQIADVLTPTSGKIIKHGRVTALLELGTGFNQELSGYENIYLNGELIGMTKKEIANNIENIVDFSELSEYIYEPLKTYSSGMKMRLAFSIAIYSEPKVLIVDEALSVGDAHFSAKSTRALKERKKTNMSIIYVSHSLNSLKLLCDRLILLDQGKIIEEGTPEDVINKYNFLVSKLNEGDVKVLINQENKTFGTFDIEIIKSYVLGKESSSSIISAGEKAIIYSEIYSRKDMSNMTIGIRITDKFGQDIFGTNTYHYNMPINFKSNKKYIFTAELDMNIGIGKYSVSIAIHSGDKHLENCSHFVDNACSFEIAGIKGNYFIGLCKLDSKFNIREDI